MKIFLSIDIASQPARVFGWLERPEKAMQWMTSVARTEILHETPERVGTTFREIVEENGNGVELQGTITDFKSDRSISFHLTSRVNELDVEYAVEAIPTGTRLTQNANVRWKFPVNVMSIFMGEKMRQGIRAQSQKEFEKLKELCESGAGKQSLNEILRKLGLRVVRFRDDEVMRKLSAVVGKIRELIEK